MSKILDLPIGDVSETVGTSADIMRGVNEQQGLVEVAKEKIHFHINGKYFRR